MKLTSYNVANIIYQNTSTNNNILASIQQKQYYYTPIISNHSGVVVRTLQLCAGSQSGQVYVSRISTQGNVLFEIPINLNAYNYLLLWQGFIYLPANVMLCVRTDMSASGVSVWASAIDQSTAITV